MNLNVNLCQQWANDPTVNPLTGRRIDPNVRGGVYEKIKKKCEELGVRLAQGRQVGEDDFTRSECEKWIINHRINPRTGRTINPESNRGVYSKLVKDCEKFNLRPARSTPRADSGPSRLSRSRSPPRAGSGPSGLQRSPPRDASAKSPRSPRTVRKESILKKLLTKCNNDTDPITLEEFADLDLEDLETIVKIGSGEKKNCYTLENIFEHYRTLLENNRLPFDPLNPSHYITTKEWNQITKLIRKKHPEIKIKRNAPRVPRNLRIHISPIFFINYFGISVSDSNTGNIASLGYIPSDIDPIDTGSQDYSSAIAVQLLMDLWDKGKLLLGNQPPYPCCSVDLNKNIMYWEEDGRQEKIRKLINMIDQFRRIL